MRLYQALRQRARRLKTDAHILYFAIRDARTPWYVKICAGLIVAYALSPIDLIPDFIPILGYLDELLLLPLGISLVIKLVPDTVLIDCKAKVAAADGDKPGSIAGAAVIILIWLIVVLFVLDLLIG